MQEFSREIEPPRPCSYLPRETARLENRLLTDVAPAEWEELLSRGWRRFGPVCFRPACSPCGACVSLRIPVADFRPSRSQRRALAAFRGFRVTTGAATASAEKVALYRRWHAAREDRVGWEPSPLDLRSYRMQFAFPHACAQEVVLYDGPRPVLVGLFDRTPRALSAVYCFYDPAIAELSPGTGNVAWTVEHARELGLAHVYLGYRVLGCRSSAYKARYLPHELLDGRPGPEATPAWTPNSA